MKTYRMKFLTCIVSLFIFQAGQCCINEYRALLNGEIVMGDEGYGAPHGRFDIHDKEYLQNRLHYIDSMYKVTGSIQDYSDLGTMLVFDGQYIRAKKIFQEIEIKSPGLYNTAANLGTTYELLGQNDSAYFWIKKAMKINPESHQGSEWIHLKILEAKIKSKGDASYFQTHNILDLDFGTDEIPVNKNAIDLNTLCQQLYNQLNERITFIKPKDPIVAQLLVDFGNASAIATDATSALEIYESAKEYGYYSDLFEKRYAYFNSLQAKADTRNEAEKAARGFFNKNPIGTLLILVGIVIVVVAAVIFLFIRIRKKRIQAKK